MAETGNWQGIISLQLAALPPSLSSDSYAKSQGKSSRVEAKEVSFLSGPVITGLYSYRYNSNFDSMLNLFDSNLCVCCFCYCESESVSCSVVSDSLWPHGLQPARVLCPWDSPRKNTGAGSHSFLRGIFPTQGSNPGLLHCRQILYWGTREAPRLPERSLNILIFG